MQPKSAKVWLNPEQVAWCHKVALEEAAKYKGEPGPYGNGNKVRGHYVGKLGEVAAQKMFKTKGIRSIANFALPNHQNEADIFLPDYHDDGVRIEVKTWRSQEWSKMGRAIRCRQWDKIYENTDMILWCVTPNEETIIQAQLNKTGLWVRIMGWNSIIEYDMNKEMYKDGNSYQIRLILPLMRLPAYLGAKR